MKRVAFLLSIIILFQSCYSYKKVDFNNYDFKKSEKVKIDLNNSKKIKGKVIDRNDSEIQLKSRRKTIKVPFSSIKKIRIRKFSILKTAGTVLGLTVIIYTIFTFKLDFGDLNRNWNWK
jgi:hypothetical protein